MNSLLFPTARKFFRFFYTMILVVLFSAKAQAVLIDFDDLTYVPEDPLFASFSDFPLHDEYRSQGLLISNAFLLPYAEGDDLISWENYLLAGAAGNSMTLSFVGDLPISVGMYLGGTPLGVLYTNVYASSGVVASHEKREGGWEYVFFESSAGISQIEMFASQQTRVSGAKIDDLTYTYASVPEPSSLILWAFAIIVLLHRRIGSIRWQHRDPGNSPGKNGVMLSVNLCYRLIPNAWQAAYLPDHARPRHQCQTGMHDKDSPRISLPN